MIEVYLAGVAAYEAEREVLPVYPLPRFTASLADALRAANRDLGGLDNGGLEDEAFAIRMRLAGERDRLVRAYLTERADLIRREQSRRRRAAPTPSPIMQVSNPASDGVPFRPVRTAGRVR